jgi:hypothetical protein
MPIGERSMDDELAVMRQNDVGQAMGLLLDQHPAAAATRRARVLTHMKTAVAIQAYHARVVECWECLFTPPGDPCWRCTPFRAGS